MSDTPPRVRQNLVSYSLLTHYHVGHDPLSDIMSDTLCRTRKVDNTMNMDFKFDIRVNQQFLSDTLNAATQLRMSRAQYIRFALEQANKKYTLFPFTPQPVSDKLTKLDGHDLSVTVDEDGTVRLYSNPFA